MIHDFLLAATGPALLSATVIAAAILLGAGLYDVVYFQQRKKLQTATRQLRKASQPHITLLIYMNNTDEGLRECLQSIVRSRYHYFDVVIVANHPSSDIRRSIRATILGIKKPVKLYTMRKQRSEQIAFQQAYKRSKRGDIVITLQSSDSIVPNFLKQTAAYFMQHDNQSAFKFARMSETSATISSVLSAFYELSRHTFDKAQTLLHFQTTTLKSGYAFPQRSFRNTKTITKWHYASDLHLYTVVQKLTQKSSTKQEVFRSLASLIVLSASVVIIIAAATLKTNTPLLLTWLLVCFWLLTIVWLDDDSSIRQKLILSICVPPSYFMILAAMIVRPISMLRR